MPTKPGGIWAAASEPVGESCSRLWTIIVEKIGSPRALAYGAGEGATAQRFQRDSTRAIGLLGSESVDVACMPPRDLPLAGRRMILPTFEMSNQKAEMSPKCPPRRPPIPTAVG